MEKALADLFFDYGNGITKHKSGSVFVGLRRFKEFFGVSPSICAKAWLHLKDVLPANYKEFHLLWALLFLKCYERESLNHSLGGCDEKTFRNRIWPVIEKLAFIKVVKWEDRVLEAVAGQTCFTSIDGVDFEIYEPTPFDTKWFSHKFKAAGLRYEIGLSLWKGEIVWAFGGYPCGAFPDLKLTRESFVDFLEPDERAVADDGYNDPTHFIFPGGNGSKRLKYIMSRHETVNKRIKQFCVLSETFRHELILHKFCFHAVVNLTQLVIKYEEPLFSIF